MQPRGTDLTVVEARTLLARAFVEDPLMRWFFPDDDTRPHACAALFGLFAEQYLAAGRVDVVRRGRPVAVAMWRWPGAAVGAAGVAPTPPGTDDRAHGCRLAPPRWVRPWGSSPSCGRRSRTPTSTSSGVDPAARGQGLGGEVLEPGLGAARGAGLTARLETMNPANVPFYEAHGLSVRHEVRLGAGGPTVWAMAT